MVDDPMIWAGHELEPQESCMLHTRVSGLSFHAAPASDNCTQQFPDAGSEGPAPLLPSWSFFFSDRRRGNQSPMKVVVSVKENPMTIENDALCDDLRAWMKSPPMGLPEYSSQPSVQRRVGRMLANFSAKFSPSGGKAISGQFYTDPPSG